MKVVNVFEIHNMDTVLDMDDYIIGSPYIDTDDMTYIISEVSVKNISRTQKMVYLVLMKELGDEVSPYDISTALSEAFSDIYVSISPQTEFIIDLSIDMN